MLGWRAIVGVIGPSRGLTSSAEFAKAAPQGVVFHRATVLGPLGISVNAMRSMLKQIEGAAKQVALAGVDLVIQVGLPPGFVNGIDGERQIIRSIEQAAGVPATTQVTAVVKALQKLQITKIIVVTSYFGEEINRLFRKYLQDTGFDVASMVDLGMDWKRSAETSPYAYYRISKAVYRDAPQAQGVLLAQGNSPASEVIEPLETDLGIPVVSSNSAALWHCLDVVGVKEPIGGLGRLLRTS